MTKVCTECKVEKTLDEYHAAKRGKYGRASKCKECRKRYWDSKKEHRKEACREYYVKNKEKIKKKVKQYRAENREMVLAKKREYTRRAWRDGTVTEEQKEKKLQQTRDWRRKNSHKVKEYNKKYKEENKPLCKQISLRRRAKLLNAQPEWVDEVDLIGVYSVVEDISWLSEESFHVDHIIPLCHENVCGLHVPWNLQIIPANQNFHKNNKFDGTYENESWKVDYGY